MNDAADNKIWVLDGDGFEEMFERDTQKLMAKWDAEHAAIEGSNKKKVKRDGKKARKFKP